MTIKLRTAVMTDMPIIVKMIGEFCLDFEELHPEQFVVADEDGKMLGFGRLKSYDDAVEMGCLGVLHERRNQGIGRMIIDELVRRGPDTIWVTTDLPGYLSPLGFQETDDMPDSIARKLERFRGLKSGRLVAMRYLKRRRTGAATPEAAGRNS